MDSYKTTQTISLYCLQLKQSCLFKSYELFKATVLVNRSLPYSPMRLCRHFVAPLNHQA